MRSPGREIGRGLLLFVAGFLPISMVIEQELVLDSCINLHQADPTLCWWSGWSPDPFSKGHARAFLAMPRIQIWWFLHRNAYRPQVGPKERLRSLPTLHSP